MNNSIFLPKTINAGFVSRDDTYTGKLAYVIYYDAKGKLRKEVSWNSWRDKTIPNAEHPNVPTSGFVLNKKAGGDGWSSWNKRNTYCRVYDPRGIEIEITIENLLYILENTSSIKGKGLEGEFVYGWDGKDLILMPTCSPDYKTLEELSKNIHNVKKFKGKDMIVGATYTTDKNETRIYMGRFDYYAYTGGWRNDIPTHKGKRYAFASTDGGYFDYFSSVGPKIVKCVSEECVGNYADLVDKLEKQEEYSKVDMTKDVPVYYTLERFKHLFKSRYRGETYDESIHPFCVDIDFKAGDYSNWLKWNESSDVITLHERKEGDDGSSNNYYRNRNHHYVETNVGTLEEFWTKHKPHYIKRHLENGNFFKTVKD